MKDNDNKTTLIWIWAAHDYLDLQTEIDRIPSALINFFVALTQIRTTRRRTESTLYNTTTLYNTPTQ